MMSSLFLVFRIRSARAFSSRLNILLAIVDPAKQTAVGGNNNSFVRCNETTGVSNRKVHVLLWDKQHIEPLSLFYNSL
jgi:hypothetical protein